MKRIFKNLIPYWKTVVVIVLLLVVQAYCDLSLPQYTSNIIDVGIQNSGIAHIVPEKITEKEFQEAQIFMDDEMIYEEYVEPHCTTRSEMRRIIDRDTYDRLRTYERTTEELEKANNLYKGFIKAMGKQFEEMFDKYVKQEGRGRN